MHYAPRVFILAKKLIKSLPPLPAAHVRNLVSVRCPICRSMNISVLCQECATALIKAIFSEGAEARADAVME